MIDLLTNWKAVFDILDKGGTPAEQDRKDLKEEVKSAIENHQEISSLITPKGHTTGKHAVWQYGIHIDLPLIIEQFVERNHQDGVKLDSQTKHIPDHIQQGITVAKRKAFQNHGVIQKRIKLVHADTVRGTCKPKQKPRPQQYQ